MSLVVARPAGELVNSNAMGLVFGLEKTVRYFLRYVLPVARKLRFPSNLVETDQYTAEIVTRPDVATIKHY